MFSFNSVNELSPLIAIEVLLEFRENNEMQFVAISSDRLVNVPDLGYQSP